MDSFEGMTIHTGTWPHEKIDFTGKRVGIIGTGSSAVQSTPMIAQEAEQLYVFQRTAQYAVPAHNRPVDPEFVAEIKADYAGFRERNRLEPSAQLSHMPGNDVSALEVGEEERNSEYEKRWEIGGFQFFGSFNDILINQEANDTAAEFVRNKIRSIVEDPEVAELLCPPHTIACKRAVIDSGYFETFNRPNVTLVDIKSAPIEKITPTGIKTADAEYDLDYIIFATGFDAMTGTLLKIDIEGRGGLTLREKWEAGPRNYLGLSVPGFPNLFTVTGPGSPSVLTNMVVAIEQHVDWITRCIEDMKAKGVEHIEATVDAENEWVEHVNEVATHTLYPTCTSWYLGANIPGKPRVFMPLPGFPDYAAKCEEVAANGYEGFVLS
jgi:cyclohexanone monooxygenase